MLFRRNLTECILRPDIANLSEQDLKSKALLCLKNSDCLEIHNRIIQQLPGYEIAYHSLDSIVTENENECMCYRVEFLHLMEMNDSPPHTIFLKPDAIVMLFSNLDVRKCSVKGTRIIMKISSSEQFLYQNLKG